MTVTYKMGMADMKLIKYHNIFGQIQYGYYPDIVASTIGAFQNIFKIR